MLVNKVVQKRIFSDRAILILVDLNDFLQF